MPATCYLTHFGTTLSLFRSRPVFSKIAGVIHVFQNWISFWIILTFPLMGTLKQENEVFLFSWSSSSLEIVKPLWQCVSRDCPVCWEAGRYSLTPAISIFGKPYGWIAVQTSPYVPWGNTMTWVEYTQKYFTRIEPLIFLLDSLVISFLGSRIASWLPSFSVEVMHTTNILGIAQASNSQLNAMVRLLYCFGPQPSYLCKEGKSCI